MRYWLKKENINTNSYIPSLRSSSSLWVCSGMFPQRDWRSGTNDTSNRRSEMQWRYIGLTFVWIPLDRNRRVDDSFSLLVSNAKENEAIENVPLFSNIDSYMNVIFCPKLSFEKKQNNNHREKCGTRKNGRKCGVLRDYIPYAKQSGNSISIK